MKHMHHISVWYKTKHYLTVNRYTIGICALQTYTYTQQSYLVQYLLWQLLAPSEYDIRFAAWLYVMPLLLKDVYITCSIMILS